MLLEVALIDLEPWFLLVIPFPALEVRLSFQVNDLM